MSDFDMNESIWDSPKQFPAVTEVSRSAIVQAAAHAVRQLASHGFAHVVLEPGDATRYEMAILESPAEGAPYRFASSFGPMYGWNGTPTQHPEYATEHYVANGNPWTGTVFALFLNETAKQMRSNDG